MIKNVLICVFAVLSFPVFAAQTLYNNKSEFVLAHGQQLSDDYSDAGYGYTTTTPAILTDSEMTAVKNAVAYEALTFPNQHTVGNLSFGRSSYCSGCNGDFILDFTSSALASNGGVLGVGFDIYLAKSSDIDSQQPLTLIVTYANGEKEQFTTSAVGYDPVNGVYSETESFWGINDTRRIASVQVGDKQSQVVIDNLIHAADDALSPIFAKSTNTLNHPISVGALLIDGTTTETVSLLFNVFAGDADDDAVGLTEYKKSSSSTWKRGLDLFKHNLTVPAPFAGMLFGLEPDTTYDVRVTIQDPDGVTGPRTQTVTVRTRTVPPIVTATVGNTVNVASAQGLTNALNAAIAGDVILLAPGTYIGDFVVLNKNGTPDNPIVIRGADNFASVISGSLKLDESDYIHVEKLHIIGDAVAAAGALRIRNWQASADGNRGIVVRNCKITNSIVGIRAEGEGRTGIGSQQLYIVDNVLQGVNAYGNVSDETWNDEGIVVVGDDVEIAYNELQGYGDSLGLSQTDYTHSVDIHDNYVIYGGDDGVELDFGVRNVAARDNLLTNTGDGLSAQYVRDGPGYAFRNVVYNILPYRGPYKIKPELACNSGVFFLNNTALSAGRAWRNFSGCGANIHIFNNLFTGDTEELDVIRLDTSGWDPLYWDYNAYIYDGRFQFADVSYLSFAAMQSGGVRGENDVLSLARPVFQNAPLLPAHPDGGESRILLDYQDPTNKDWRPGEGSLAIDAGKVLPSINDSYSGSAPEIGAYETTDPPLKHYGVRDTLPVYACGDTIDNDNDGDIDYPDDLDCASAFDNNEATESPIPTVAFNAVPDAINEGESTDITWSTTDATTCTGVNFNTGGAASGTVADSPTADKNYIIQCEGGGGVVNADEVVTVAQVFECNDGIDNDGDTLIDFPNDPGCINANDDDETDQVGHVLDSLAPGLWYEVPNSNLSAVDPCPANDCAYSPVQGQLAVIRSWGGGAYDSTRDLYLLWGGGHADYGGNEVYAFDVDALTWSRLTEPDDPVIDAPLSLNGLPASRHTYDYIEYVPGIDMFCSFGGAALYGTGNASTARTDCLDLTVDASGTLGQTAWNQFADTPTWGAGGMAIVDPDTGYVWVHGALGGGPIARWDPITDTYVQYGNQWTEGWTYGGRTMALDTTRDQIYAPGGTRMYYWDISQASIDTGAIPRQLIVTTGPQDVVNDAAPGFIYDPVNDRYIGWAGGATIYAFNPDTLEWTIAGPDAANSVIPTNATTNGTYGRMRYMPRWHALIVTNDHDENVWFYKLDTL